MSTVHAAEDMVLRFLQIIQKFDRSIPAAAAQFPSSQAAEDEKIVPNKGAGDRAEGRSPSLKD